MTQRVSEKRSPSIEVCYTDRTMLRRGWTTGACATAAAKAACLGLIYGTIPNNITIQLPGGIYPKFNIKNSIISGRLATASVIKDAGDDPDITHGAEVVVDVTLAPAGHGLVFQAGAGVGCVTCPGLALEVGEPAINCSPRAMIKGNIAFALQKLSPDLLLTVGIVNGVKLAKYTLNSRLGIIGGLSVLGTTGIVIPYSCAAWIKTIQHGVDIARATGLTHIVGATGRTSEQAAQKLLGLSDSALIEMGDFVGVLLKYLRYHPIPHLTLAGGFAKLAKLAQGELNLHSGRCSFNAAFLAHLALRSGAIASLVTLISSAKSAQHALILAKKAGFDLSSSVAREAHKVAMKVVESTIKINIVIFDSNGNFLAGEPSS